LTNLRGRVRRRPEMWKNGSWDLHQDNARGTQRPVYQDVFDEAQDHRGETSTVFT